MPLSFPQHKDGTVELVDDEGLSLKITGDREVWFKRKEMPQYSQLGKRVIKGKSKIEKETILLRLNRKFSKTNLGGKDNGNSD